MVNAHISAASDESEKALALSGSRKCRRAHTLGSGCVPRKLVKVSQLFDLGHMLATFFLRVILLNLKKSFSSFVICPISLKLPVVWIAVWPIDLELHNELTFSLACGYAVLSFLNGGLISEAGDFHLSRHQEIHLGGL